MAVSLGREGGEYGDLAENAEINVTPFIDVMLVLLIIFMVAAPLSTVDAPVDLPVSTARPQPRPEKPLFITIKADLSMLVNEDTVPIDRLATVLDERTNNGHDQRLFVRADKSVPYGEIMRLMNALRAAGYLRIAFVGLETGGDGAGAPAAATPAAATP